MTAERDERAKRRPDRSEPSPAGAGAAERFDEALREVVADDDETSCEDADAGAFLERFPAAAREPQRPKTD